MSIEVPDTAKEAILDEVLEEIYEALAPPASERLDDEMEFEVEFDDEGVFHLAYAEGELEGNKGYADEPLLSAKVPAGGWDVVRRILQAAVDGFPDAPMLARRQTVAKDLKRADIRQAFDGVKKIKDGAVEVVVPELGSFAIARGALDEATRKLLIEIPAGATEKALGGDLEALRGTKVGGDKRLVGDLIAAAGQAWVRVRAG